MSDFIGELEAQLLDAARRRAALGGRAPRRRPSLSLGRIARGPVIAVAVVALAALVVVLALPGGREVERPAQVPAEQPSSIDAALARGQAAPAPALAQALLADAKGARNPAWRAAAADGRVDLRELRGVPVAVTFTASWCAPCARDAATVTRMVASGSDAVVVGVATSDAARPAAVWRAGKGLEGLPLLIDPAGRAARAWAVHGVPDTFFLDRGGRVVAHVLGTGDAGALRAGLDAARGGHVLAPEPLAGRTAPAPLDPRPGATAVVLNATRVAGAAADARHRLIAGGVLPASAVATGGYVTREPESVVRYRAGFRETAARIAARLGVARVAPMDARTRAVVDGTARGTPVAVVLGSGRAR